MHISELLFGMIVTNVLLVDNWTQKKRICRISWGRRIRQILM